VASAYTLPLQFKCLLRTDPVATHFEHDQFEQHGQSAALDIVGFIMRLEPGILIPMEETVITGCAICAIVAKVKPYIPKQEVDGRIRSFHHIGVCAALSAIFNNKTQLALGQVLSQSDPQASNAHRFPVS
jgi:hypothetical protein